MATKKIRVEVEAPGADTAADKIEGVATAAGGLDAEQKKAATSSAALTARQQQASLKAIEFGTKLAAASAAVQGLTSALGSDNATIGLIGKAAQSSAAMAQLGGVAGPQGALVGGILGALIPAIQALIAEEDELAEAAKRATEEQTRLDEINRRMSADRQAQIQREIASGRILTLSIAEIQRERLLAEDRVRVAIEDRDALERELAGASGQRAAAIRDGIAEQNAVLRTQIGIIGNLGEAEGRRISAPATRGQGTPAVAPRRRGGSAPDQSAEDRAETARLQAEYERQQEQAARLNEIEQRRVNEAQRIREEELKAEEELQARIAQLRQEQFANERRLREEETERSRTERAKALEEARAGAAVAIEQVANVADGIGRAIAKIAETNATADESAKIALATTLELIGQTAQMLAGMEFAKAIASYPDVAGMALHAAAGIAFTAVAIGTGEGAGALNRDVAASQAARAEKPEKPESGGAAAKSGGDTVININSPIVTAQTHAELGRNIRNTLLVAERRAA